MSEMNCPICHEHVEDNFNMCPYCGEPLNNLAKTLYAKKETNGQLKLLAALLGKIKDPHSIAVLTKALETLKKR